VFTGIVEVVGRVRHVRDVTGARVFGLEVALAPAPAAGDSVAVNGVCLTVERADAGGFDATAVAETLSRTTLGELVAGDGVNIERAATLERALGGHLVQGHVDGVGSVVSIARAAGEAGGGWLDVAVPAEIHDLCVEKGSIAIDGVSLTIARRGGDGRVEIALVPHTLERTIAGRYVPGRRVNVEADVVAKYVREYVKRLYPALPR
jgi:riboflavin synthase